MYLFLCGQHIFSILLFSPLRAWQVPIDPIYKQLEYSCFVPGLNEIGHLVLKKTMEIWKKIKKTTDDGYTYISIRKSFVNLDSGELDSGELHGLPLYG